MNIVIRRLMNFRVLEYKSKPENNFRIKGKMKSEYDVDSRNSSSGESTGANNNQEDLGSSILDMTRNNNKGGFRDYGKSRPETMRHLAKTIYKTHDHSMLKLIQQDHARNLSTLLRRSKDPTKTDQSRILKKSTFKGGSNDVVDEDDERDSDFTFNFNVALRTPIDDLGEEATTTEFIDGVHSNRTHKHLKHMADMIEYDLLPAKTKCIPANSEAEEECPSPILNPNNLAMNFRFGSAANQMNNQKGLAPSSNKESNQIELIVIGIDVEERMSPSIAIPPNFLEKEFVPHTEQESSNDKLQKDGGKSSAENLVNQLMKHKLKVLVSSNQGPEQHVHRLHSRTSSGLQAGTTSGKPPVSRQGIKISSPNLTNNISGIVGSHKAMDSSIGDVDEKFNLSAINATRNHKRRADSKNISKKGKKKQETEASPKAKKQTTNTHIKSSNSIVIAKSSQQRNTFSYLLQTISCKDSDTKGSIAHDSVSNTYSPEKRQPKHHANHGASMNLMSGQPVVGFLVNISNNVVTTQSRESTNTPVVMSENPKNNKYLRRLETGSFNFVTDSKKATPQMFECESTVQQLKSDASKTRSTEQVVIETERSPFSVLNKENGELASKMNLGGKAGQEPAETLAHLDITNNKHYQKIFRGLTINPEAERHPSHSTKHLFLKQKTSLIEGSPSNTAEYSPLRNSSVTNKGTLESKKQQQLDKLLSSQKGRVIHTDRKPAGSSNLVKSFSKAIGQPLVVAMTERKRKSSINSLSRKRYSRPNLESLSNNDSANLLPKVQMGWEQPQHTNPVSLGSPANLTYGDIEHSDDMASNKLSKKHSLEPVINDRGSQDHQTSFELIGHIQSNNESHTLSSIKHNSTLRSGVFGTSRNLDELANFIPAGSSLLDCESMKNLQAQVFKKQKPGIVATSHNYNIARMEEVPTESAEVWPFECEPDVKSLDMVTQLSKPKLIKGIRGLFHRQGQNTSLVTSRSHEYIQYDGLVCNFPDSKVQWLIKVYDLEEFRYVDYFFIPLGDKDLDGSQRRSVNKAAAPLSFKNLAEAIQAQIYIIMLEIKLFMDQAVLYTE
jgi:hypothetical protein